MFELIGEVAYWYGLWAMVLISLDSNGVNPRFTECYEISPWPLKLDFMDKSYWTE